MIRALAFVLSLTSLSAVAFEDSNDQTEETNIVCSIFTAAKHRTFMKTPANDKFKHCTMSCIITINCGAFEAMNTGILKEIIDVVTPGDSSIKDIEADMRGVRVAAEGKARTFKACESECNQIFPAKRAN